MLKLYPAIKPYCTHKLQVDDIHELYLEESGSVTGVPVLVLHGGPGLGSDPDYRRFFNTKHNRIILFYKRGCGRSTPYGELRNNDTNELIGDIEKIRNFLGIEKWGLFGHCWGATLSLLYALAHPQQVLSMILSSVMLCRRQDFAWLYDDNNGAAKVYPEDWKRFINKIPESQRNNILREYHNLLTGHDDLARMNAAKAWGRWHAKCATLEPCQDLEKKFTMPNKAFNVALIASHYFLNNIFVAENIILNNIAQLSNVPGVIVHGRYDMVSTLDNAYLLNERWPSSRLNIVRNAGHYIYELGIVNELIHATNEMVR